MMRTSEHAYLVACADDARLVVLGDGVLIELRIRCTSLQSNASRSSNCSDTLRGEVTASVIFIIDVVAGRGWGT